MKKRIVFVLFVPGGMFLLFSGLFMEHHVMSGVLVGIGTIVLGLSAAKAVPLLALTEAKQDSDQIDWQDERNMTIREKASWYAGIITIAAMSVSALVLALIDQMIGACVIAGLLLVYSVSIIIFSGYFSSKL